MPAQHQQKRVAIVGAGCAGLSAAYSLSLSPQAFEGTVYDGAPIVGGSATSHALPPGFGAEYLNEGVQGAPETFRNTFNLFHDVLGFQSKEIEMQISFGKGENFWTNIFPTQLIEEHKDNIKRFGGTLSTIKRFEPVFALVPVSKLLPLFRYPPAFGERIVFPLVALFFGTGNETKHISSAILARVFLDPSMRIFDYSPDSFLASLPTMLAFPELGRLYGAFRTLVEEPGNVKVRTSRAVTAVLRGAAARKAGGANVVIRSCSTDEEGKPTGENEEEEPFDELVLCCDADSALKMLRAGSGPSWKENKVLGNVKYFWDISVTHHDKPYMQKHYELEHTDRWNADRDDKETQESFKWAKENWAPLYLIEEDEKDPASITMSFDLTTYQPQFYGDPAVGKGARRTLENAPPTERVGKDEWKTKEHPLKDIKEGEQPRIYQTIFLDRDGFSHRWSRDEIDKEKILMEKWWKQQSHRWQHLVGTVALMWAINGTQHTRYAGGWTLVNMHESAVVSGFAAVYQLGASYPFAQDDEAARLFKLYLALAHMSRARKEDRRGFFA